MCYPKQGKVFEFLRAKQSRCILVWINVDKLQQYSLFLNITRLNFLHCHPLERRTFKFNLFENCIIIYCCDINIFVVSDAMSIMVVRYYTQLKNTIMVFLIHSNAILKNCRWIIYNKFYKTSNYVSSNKLKKKIHK